MPRRGRLDDFLHDDELDDDETGATVVMDGGLGATMPFGEEDDADDDSESAATVVMGSSDVHALLEAEGLLEETFDPWVEEQETRLDHDQGLPRVMDWVEPGQSDVETQRLVDNNAVTQRLPSRASDPGLPEAAAEPERSGPSMLVFGVIAGVLVGGVLVAAAMAILGVMML